MLSEPAESYVRDGCEITFTSEVRLELLRAVTEKGKPFRFRAFGNSMLPFISDQDILTIAPQSANCPSPGDVVAFILPDIGKIIVHRVVKTGENAFQLKGDNTKEPDGVVPRVNILGTVTRVERDGRNITAGLGRERRLIAFTSRHDLLRRIVWVIRLPNRIGAAGLRKVRVLAGYLMSVSRS